MSQLTKEYFEDVIKLTEEHFDEVIKKQTQELKAYTDTKIDEKIDELAMIVSKGFDHQQKQLDRIEQKVDVRDRDIEKLKQDSRIIKDVLVIP